jgi:hypothetical protein
VRELPAAVEKLAWLAADGKIHSSRQSASRRAKVSSSCLCWAFTQRWISSAITSSELPIAADADNAHLSGECSEGVIGSTSARGISGRHLETAAAVGRDGDVDQARRVQG